MQDTPAHHTHILRQAAARLIYLDEADEFPESRIQISSKGLVRNVSDK